MAPAVLKQKNAVARKGNVPLEKKHALPMGGTFPAAKAKTHFLEMLSEIVRSGDEFVITKRGRPVARLVPFSGYEAPDIFGCMRGTAKVTGDVISPLPAEEWGDLA